jgi:hypothetical protein
MKNALILIGTAVLFLSCFSSQKTQDAPSTITAREIIKQINQGKNISVKNKTIIGDLDFTKIPAKHQIAEYAFKIEIKTPIYFDNCVFEGNIVGFRQDSMDSYICSFASDVVFSNSRIKGSVDWSHNRFKAFFTFSNNLIESDFNASNAIYHDEVQLSKSIFEKDLFLTFTLFQQRSNMMDMKVMGKTYLQGSVYKQQSLWSNSIFDQYVDMSKVTVQHSLFLDHCKFNHQLHISGSHFWGYVNISTAQFEDVLTIRTSTFVAPPVLTDIKVLNVKYEKNRLLTDEKLEF